MAAPGGIEGRNTHQAVHAVFAAQKTVGVVPLHQNGRGLDARLVALQIVQHLHGPVVACGKARVHAVQHLHPVLSLCAARARMEGQDGIVRVIFSIQQRHKAQLLPLGVQAVHGRVGLLRQGGVVVFRTHFQQRFGILQHGLQSGVLLQPVLQLAHLGKHRAGRCRVVVKLRAGALLLQLLQTHPAALDGQRVVQIRYFRRQLGKAALYFI